MSVFSVLSSPSLRVSVLQRTVPPSYNLLRLPVLQEYSLLHFYTDKNQLFALPNHFHMFNNKFLFRFSTPKDQSPSHYCQVLASRVGCSSPDSEVQVEFLKEVSPAEIARQVHLLQLLFPPSLLTESSG